MNSLPLITPAPDMMGEVHARLDRSCPVWTATDAATQDAAIAALSRLSDSSCDPGFSASGYGALRLSLCVYEGTGWNLSFPKDDRYNVCAECSAESCRWLLGMYLRGCANPDYALATARRYAEVHESFGGQFPPEVERLLTEGDSSKGRRALRWVRPPARKPHPLEVKRSASGGLAPEPLVQAVEQLFSEGHPKGLTFQEVRSQLDLGKDGNATLQRALNECVHNKSIFEMNPNAPGNPRPGERLFFKRR